MRADDEGNMNEKMTDEELSLILARIRTELGHTAESDLSAHIAALAAERDSEKAAHRLTAEGWWADARLWNGERDALRERVQALEKQGTADWVALCAIVGWSSGTATCPLPAPSRAVAAVVSLVQTLEADLDHSRKSIGKALMEERAQAAHLRECYESERNARVTAESRLAAIRQRVETLSPELRLFVERALLNDARPSAPPEAFTHEKGLDAGVFDEAPQPNARVIAYEGGQPIVLATMPPRPEPTTSEAFATVRNLFGINVLSENEQERGISALSLLERRMGVQQRALEETLKLHHRMPGDIIRMIQNALTDAPAVFTLGEVKEALTEHIGDLPAAVNEVVERLTALRK